MEFRVLGPLEVHSGGAVVPLRTPTQRSLLATLLLSSNRAVAHGRLVEALWGQAPPVSAVADLRSHVAALRRVLSVENGGGARVVTRSGGYLMVIEPGELDLSVFDNLVDQGRRALQEDQGTIAAERFAQALGLWRGEPLTNVTLGGSGEAEVTALGEVRLTVVEDWLQARLSCGEHADVISELRRLSAEHPLRESFWALLMLALHRAGRQGDALAAYDQARTRLVDELGLDPGPQVQELRQRILTNDPSLIPSSVAVSRRDVPRSTNELAGRAPELGQLDVVAVVGRRRERRELEDLLTRADDGVGGVLVIAGVGGAGKTAMADVAAELGRSRGFAVVRASAVRGRDGRAVWAQVLRDIDAPEDLVARLATDARGTDLDDAARHLVSGVRRLIVVDDVDHGGQRAIELLSAVAGRAAAASTAVVATSTTALGVGRQLMLTGLDAGELAATLRGAAPLDEDMVQAILVASQGLPGIARSLAADLGGLDDDVDPVVHLALRAMSSTSFLVIDPALLRLLELATSRARDDGTRARLLARLACELLGDSSTGARRRTLAGEALTLAKKWGDGRILAEVLDAWLHAVWEPDGTDDRLALGRDIVELARAAGDGPLERKGLFWQFVALMELGRVTAAEAVLVTFERDAATAGDGQALAMAAGRHGMLALLRGQFDDVETLAAEVVDRGRRAGMADTDRLAMTLRGLLWMEREPSRYPIALDAFRDMTRLAPGHFWGADLARILVLLGRYPEARTELERLLPTVLAGSGPRWLAAISHLALVAAATQQTEAAAKIYDALLPYRGKLVVLGGANSTWGPVAHYLGLLASQLGRYDDAVEYFEEALAFNEEVGALPSVVYSLTAFADTVTLRAADGDGQRASQYRDRARSIAERLGMVVFLEGLARPADEWSLARDGDDWVFEVGSERARLRDGRGLHYLRALLAAPGKEIPALDLVAGGAGLVSTGAAPILDDTARQRYRARIVALETELDDAGQSGDTARAAKANTEREALLDELRRATGLGGRPRRDTAEAERARVNVTRTVRAVIDRLAVTAPAAAAYLHACVRTGQACRYEPAPGGPTRWHV